MTSTPLRAAIYARLSKDPLGTAAAVDRQITDCRERAAREGWQVVDEYVDRDKSASKRGVERPEWERLLRDLREHRIDVVLSWKADRLARRVLVMAEFRELLTTNGAFLATIDGVDTRNHAGRVHLGLLGEFAASEAETISFRTKRAKEAARAAGKPHQGGRRPFGHDRDGRVVESEADAIRRAHEALLNGESVLGIARSWAAEGITTDAGEPWGAPHLRRMLVQPRLCGAREGADGEWIATGAIEPIVSEADLRRVRAVLTAPGRVTTTPRKHENLLTGVAYCGLCGARLVISNSRKGQVYTCRSRPDAPGCGKVGASVARADEHVEQRVLAVLTDSDRFRDLLAQFATRADTSGIAAKLEADRAALVDAEDARYVRHTLSESSFERIRSKLEASIAAGERALSDASGVPLLASIDPSTIAESWESGSLDWRRSVVRSLVERIDVAPAERPFNVWRPERLAITSRYGPAKLAASA